MEYDQLSKHTREDILNNMDLEGADEIKQKESLESISADEAFERWLEWQGIIGFGDSIAHAYREIVRVYGVPYDY